MIILVCALIAVASVPLLGGDVRRLGSVRFRDPGLLWGAIALQAALVSSLWAPPLGVARGVHVGTYALVATFVVVNRRIPGVPVIATGGALNAVAILANGGVMPASAAARRVAGLAAVDGFSNSAPVAAPRLAWLGDVFAIPSDWPFANVFSVGDVVIVAGAFALAHGVCRRRALTPLR